MCRRVPAGFNAASICFNGVDGERLARECGISTLAVCRQSSGTSFRVDGDFSFHVCETAARCAVERDQPVSCKVRFRDIAGAG